MHNPAVSSSPHYRELCVYKEEERRLIALVQRQQYMKSSSELSRPTSKQLVGIKSRPPVNYDCQSNGSSEVILSWFIILLGTLSATGVVKWIILPVDVQSEHLKAKGRKVDSPQGQTGGD